MRALYWWFVGAACASAAVIILCRGVWDTVVVSTDPGSVGGAGLGSLPTLSAAVSESGGDALREVLRYALIVVASDSGRPVSGANVTWLRREDAPSTLVDPAFAVADAVGRIEIERAPTDRVLLCRAPGYVPTTVAVPDAVEQQVALHRCGTLLIAVVDELGRGVPDAHVVVTHQPAGGLQMDWPVGIGHPLSTHPRWCSTTDARGESRIDELPPGKFFLNVVSNSMVPVDELAANGVFEIAATSHRVTVTMQEAYGVCFRVPSRSPVKDITWSIPHERLAVTPRVTARLALLRQAVADMIPDSLVQVHVPLIGSPVVVRCHVKLQDGTFWMGESALVRVTELEVPTFLEQYQGAMRMITFEVRDPDGKTYGDFPIVLRNRSGGLSLKTVTGAVTLVPDGTYKVNPGRMDLAVHEALEGLVAIVDAKSPAVVTARLAEPLSEIVIKFEYPSGEVRSPLMIEISDEDGRGANVANYLPDRGIIRRLVTGRTVHIKISSIGYEDVEIGPAPLERTHANQFDVRLAVRPR